MLPGWDKALPRTGELSEMTQRLAQYGNVKIELIGHALGTNQAMAILTEYGVVPEPPVTITQRSPPKP